MNEELRIVISADNTQANNGIKKTKEELKKLQEQQEKSKKYIADTMAAVKKGAAVAIAAVTATVAAMAALGQQALENQKNIGRLTTAFEGLGSSAKQAKQTYSELYGFLGDGQTATEAANLLAQITTNTEDLTQWTRILQGAYATFPDSLPVEALAEATNETIKTGVVTGNLADAVNWLGVSEDAVNEQLATLNSTTEREAYLRGLLNDLYGTAADNYAKNNKEVIQHNKSQANLQTTLASLSKALTPMLTALNNLATVLLTTLTPAFQVVSAAIIVFCEWLAQAVTWIAKLFGIKVAFEDTASSLSGTNKGLDEMGNSIDTNQKKAEKLKRSVMGFDELNVVSDNSSSSGGGGAATVAPVVMPTVDTSALNGAFSNFESIVEQVREAMQGILVLVGLIGLGIIAWKILDAYTAGVKLKGVFEGVGAKALIIAGAVLLVKGYCDAWVNGIDWGNLLLVIGGIAAVLTGVGMQFGSFGVAIGLVAAGIAAIVLGVKDFINNGASLQNTILIIGGAVAIAVGLATAGLSTLVSVIVGVVAAVAAFTAAILLEEEVILSTEEAQKNLTAAKEAAAEAENNYISAVDAADQALQRLKDAEEKAGVTGAELYKQVQSGTLDYANMTAEQKEVYKAYLDNEQKQKDLEASTIKLNEAKKAETLAALENEIALGKEAGSYDKCKESIIKAYEEGAISADECRDLLSKSMSEMSDDAQKTFMEDIPGDIKSGLDPNKYETTRKKMGDWFRGVGKFFSEQIWQPVKDWWNKSVKPIFTKKWWSDKFKAIQQAFSDLWESIKKKFSEVGTTVGNAVSGAFKNAINWVLEKAISIINGFLKAINAGIDIINAIPGLNIKKLKMLEVPQLAKGGIATGDTLAHIGEQGYKEAVLPLDRNTEWMDVLADRIAARNGAPSKLVLNVDGKELGYATINSFNSIYTQTGSLPLVVM